ACSCLPWILSSKEFPNDVTAGEQATELAFAHHGQLLDVLVEHHVGCLDEPHVLRDAEDGASHDVTHAQGLLRLRRALLLVARARYLRQQRAHHVPLT